MHLQNKTIFRKRELKMTTEEKLELILGQTIETAAYMKIIRKEVQQTKDVLKNIQKKLPDTENYLLLKKETADLNL